MKTSPAGLSSLLQPNNIFPLLHSSLQSLLSLVNNLLLVVFLILFILLESTQMRSKLSHAGSSEAIHGAVEFCQKINRYMIYKGMFSAITGSYCYYRIGIDRRGLSYSLGIYCLLAQFHTDHWLNHCCYTSVVPRICDWRVLLMPCSLLACFYLLISQLVMLSNQNTWAKEWVYHHWLFLYRCSSGVGFLAFLECFYQSH